MKTPKNEAWGCCRGSPFGGPRSGRCHRPLKLKRTESRYYRRQFLPSVFFSLHSELFPTSNLSMTHETERFLDPSFMTDPNRTPSHINPRRSSNVLGKEMRALWLFRFCIQSCLSYMSHALTTYFNVERPWLMELPVRIEIPEVPSSYLLIFPCTAQRSGGLTNRQFKKPPKTVRNFDPTRLFPKFKPLLSNFPCDLTLAMVLVPPSKTSEPLHH